MISYTHIEAGITDVEDITLEPLQIRRGDRSVSADYHSTDKTR
jgi:hypothetical protein